MDLIKIIILLLIETNLSVSGLVTYKHTILYGTYMVYIFIYKYNVHIYIYIYIYIYIHIVYILYTYIVYHSELW